MKSLDKSKIEMIPGSLSIEDEELLNEAQKKDHSDMHLDNPLPIRNIELEISLQKMLDDLPYQLENIKIMARLTRAKYESLIETGFSKTQALELCKKIL